MTPLPVVAVVGRPNVGKSTLFNRIVGHRTAIVEDRARTTRDRIYGDAEWNGRRFIVVDTGGLEISPGDAIEEKVQDQARLAIAEADLIVLVVDSIAGLTPADQEASELLRVAKAPVLVAANKADNDRRELEAAEFYSLGWEETYAISAAHGRGVADLLDAVVWALPPESEAEIERKRREVEADEWARGIAEGNTKRLHRGRDEAIEVEPDDEETTFEFPDETDQAISIALVGRPNVGKSSLLNSLLGEERAIVSDIPGTTRDAIDTHLVWGRSEVVLIDTAGIRRPGKVASGPAAERYSTLRALKAVGRADVAVLVIDAPDGLTAQDAHVAGFVLEEGRGLVLAVNKWDIVADKTDRTFDEYAAGIRAEVPFLELAPIVSISAKTGQRVSKVLELAVDIWGERRKRIPTPELNRVIRAATTRQAPPPGKGAPPKIFYATQVAVAPPTFVFFARNAGEVHFSYARYMENQLRAEFGFDGTPIRLIFRERSSVKLPRIRKGGGPVRRTAGSRSSMGSKPSGESKPSAGSKPFAGSKPSGAAARRTGPSSRTRRSSGGKS
ncbi:MAG TPA: ribosome biogenesis GTPase Der [Candidatus Limnocylindrales bacterium]